MKFLIALIVIIAVLAFILSRRGSSGLGSNGSTDSVEGSLGHTRRDGPGGNQGYGSGL